MSYEKNTQITRPDGYNAKQNMIFSKVKLSKIPKSNLESKRIMISTRNPDGTFGELVIPTPWVFSFGLQENTNMVTGDKDGYQISFCLQSKTGQTPEEKAFVDFFSNITEVCKEHVLKDKVKDDLKLYELSDSDFKKFNPIYIKKEKGKPVEGADPFLYAKVLQHTKDEVRTIAAQFYDVQGKQLDPLSILGQRCNVQGIIKIESIFFGQRPSLQLKVMEVTMELAGLVQRRLLAPMQVENTATTAAASTDTPVAPSNLGKREIEDDSDDSDSEDDSDSDNE